MAMRAILRNLGAKSGPAKNRAAPSDADGGGVDAAQRLALLDAIEASGIGWFWATDAEHRLT
jgi:hypothetical protein